MKILLAPDSFKGSMTSVQIIKYIEEIALTHFNPLEIVKVPIADGGEGTVDAIVLASGNRGIFKTINVIDPLGRDISAKYGIIDGKTAIIEMAQASGLPLISADERNPLITTSFGTGQLLKAAIQEGIRDIVIGIGGSATNDGGIGAMKALGIKFLDSEGKDVGSGGNALAKVKNIDISEIDAQVKECHFTIICDVSNPITGPEGATYTFGPQKGADEEMLKILEAGMINYAKVLNKKFNIDVDSIFGGGAAGGLGASLAVFLNAEMRPGIETVLDTVNFDDLLENVDLVITGEGRIDGQSVYGKVPVGVASRCKKKNIPVIAIVGSIGQDAFKVYEYGITSIFPIVNSPMSLESAMCNAEILIKDTADRVFRALKINLKH